MKVDDVGSVMTLRPLCYLQRCTGGELLLQQYRNEKACTAVSDVKWRGGAVQIWTLNASGQVSIICLMTVHDRSQIRCF